MKNRDFLIRGLFKNLNIRFAFTETTNTVNEGILTHSCSPVAGELFGKALTVAALLNPLLNENEKYSIKWEYSGLISNILVDVTHLNEIRGVVAQPLLSVSRESFQELYGEDGIITMMKFEDSKILNSGTAKAAMLDICEDISFFMSTSDQLESEFSAYFKFKPDPESPVKIFSGIMLQEMPNVNLDKLEEFRHNLKSEKVAAIMQSSDLPSEEKLWKIVEALDNSGDLYSELKKRDKISYTFAPSPIYKCSCSVDKMKQAVMTLKKEEIKSILEKEGEIKITCHFCNKHYLFKKSDFNL